MHLLEQEYQGLTLKHLQAIELIATGKTDTEVSEAIGVGRDTVNRWRNHNPNFRKALEAHQAFLTIYARAGRLDYAFQVFKLLKAYLPPSVFLLVITFLKLENLATRTSTRSPKKSTTVSRK